MFAYLNQRPFLQIHFCVFLWGFTGILGKLISLSALSLVFWRLVLVLLILMCFKQVWRGLRAFSIKNVITLAFVGALVALHWVTFYAAIRLANASVAAVCIALASVFVVFIEPWVFKKSIQMSEVLMAAFAVLGVLMMMGGVSSELWYGFLIGSISAFLLALFSISNKKYSQHLSVFSVTFIEFLSGICVLAIIGMLMSQDDLFIVPSMTDWGWLIILAVFCTLIPFLLTLQVIKKVSAFSVQLATNLEPLYTIAFAVLIFHEHQQLSLWFYIGVVCLLTAVVTQPYWKHFNKSSNAIY